MSNKWVCTKVVFKAHYHVCQLIYLKTLNLQTELKKTGKWSIEKWETIFQHIIFIWLVTFDRNKNLTLRFQRFCQSVNTSVKAFFICGNTRCSSESKLFNFLRCDIWLSAIRCPKTFHIRQIWQSLWSNLHSSDIFYFQVFWNRI